MRTEGLYAAYDEWDYQHTESNVFPDRTMAASVPCQLRFVGDVEQDTETFHDVLRDNGYTPVDHEPDGKATDDSPHYEGEACNEQYHRVKILVFRGDLVRVYPKDEYIPTVDELRGIVQALEHGFDSFLKHDPIEPDCSQNGDKDE